MKAMRTVSMQDDCFVAGTLVHTKEGLKPIEQIKVGDWVLSKPEMGEGEQAYKRVVKTVSFEEKEAWTVTYYEKDVWDQAVAAGRMVSDDIASRLIVTPNHPFWVKGKGWTQVSDLMLHNELELENGSSALVSDVFPLCRSESDDIAYLPRGCGLNEGSLIDLRNGNSCEFEFPKQWIGEPLYVDFDDPSSYFHTTVYNFEVDDFHTYYVGTKGIWVHNTNCGENVGDTAQTIADSLIPLKGGL